MPGAPSIKRRAELVNERLVASYPGTADELCALRSDTPFQLLVATILSAQCTDERVNQVMPEMIRRYPIPQLLAVAPVLEVEDVVHSTGFFRAKAKNLIAMANALVERYAGEVPHDLEELVSLPGVGRKTGNVIRSVAFGLPGLPVDTHVGRLARRLGLTEEMDPVKVEHEICRLLPEIEWGGFSLRLILHGRAVCVARSPRCAICELADLCPSSPANVAKRSRRSSVGSKGQDAS